LRICAFPGEEKRADKIGLPAGAIHGILGGRSHQIRTPLFLRKCALILGITGNIAAGKSTICEFFRRLGAAVVSADSLAREVVAPGSPVLAQLTERFGRRVIAADGTLDRKALADLVFAEDRARFDLNQIIHPAIAASAEERLQSLNRCTPLVIYEAPLLYEAGAEKRVDAVLVVTVTEERQMQRLTARDGLSEAEARARIAAQMPQAEKIARADFVIDNSGAPEIAAARVRELYEKLTKN